MAAHLKNMLCSEENWQIQIAGQDPADLDIYLEDENQHLREQNQKFKQRQKCKLS